MGNLSKATRALALGGVLAAGMTNAAERVSIPLADLGNIRDWHADNSNELYVQNMNREWFHITFWMPCIELPSAIGIAFVTEGLGSLDKYSSILVGSERCDFRTFERSAPPPSHDDNEVPKEEPAE